MPGMKKETFNKYKVLHGCHVEGGKVYMRGKYFVTSKNLAKHDPHGAKYKLIKVNVDPKEAEKTNNPPAPEPPEGGNTAETLNAMTIEELRRFAEEEEIDLEGMHLKQDIIDAILSGV